MSEAIEKAARAIYETMPVGERGWEDAPTYTRDRCIACAKAALSTTLEPSEEECEAALDAYIGAGALLTTEAMRVLLKAAAVARLK